MSQIFDALHQSASERADKGVREFSAAKDLLELVERKTKSPRPLPDSPAAQPGHLSLPEFPSVNVLLRENSRFACFSDSESLAAEKFRFLATRLRHLQQKRSLKRLVITSSVMGEGKSIVAANLACALAAGKQRVLLVEGDLRRPSLGRELGLEELPGLSQILRNLAETSNHVYSLKSSGLCVLLAGDAHSNPLEFIVGSRLPTLMDNISTSFDWVIIDSPPVLPLADTSIWVRMADGILLVVRPGVTPKRQLQKTFEAVEQSKVLGSVVNGSSEITENHYYHYYRPDGPQVPNPAAK